MGNMFCDKITGDSIAGNVTKGICDHLIQFLTEPSTFSKDNEKRSTTHRRCKHFSKENFTNEINNINWEEVSESKRNDVNYFMDSFLHIATDQRDKHIHIKTKSNKTFTLNDKAWTSRAIRKCIKIRNKIYKQYCKEKKQTNKKNFYMNNSKLTRTR